MEMRVTMNNLILKRLFLIAIPIIISNLISQCQLLIDKIFLGKLDLLCMSAVGNASSPIWTTMNTIFTLTVGGTILMSQAIGADDKKKAKAISASLFKFSNILSLFWFVFWVIGARIIFKIMGVDESIIDMSVSYAKIYSPIFLLIGMSASIVAMLQVCEKTAVMIGYGIIRSVTNIVLDYVFIFGKFGFPRMEVRGAALATLIAEFVGYGLIIIYFMFEKKLKFKPTINEIFNSKLKYYWLSIKKGIPAAVEEFAWNLGNLFLISMLNKVSTVAAGVYSIVFSIELIPTSIYAAIAAATLTLCGQEVGKKNIYNIKSIVKMAMISSLVLSLIILCFFLSFPKRIMGWFTTDNSIISVAIIYLIIIGIDLFPKSANAIIGSGIRGYGNTIWMLKTQIVGTLFVMICSAILVMFFKQDMKVLFCLVVADESLRCTLNYFKLKRIVNS